jgi:HSP20 family protein
MRKRNDIDQVKSEMEELFADLCQVPRLTGQRRAFRPLIDVYRTEDPPTLTVVVELAGVDPADVELAVADGVLAIAGNRVRERVPGRVYQHMEIDYGPFGRRIPLSEPVDADGAEASYARGVLTIVLPIATRPSGPVKVAVTARRSG